ncbi:MAG: gliding motility protein GldM [Bacteroidales bacterium]|jgi:gliding motility-associated protein GldM
MAAYKETPRQKMIAMLYLILTAMLALNVSVELLNAFLIVNETIAKTNETFDAKTGELYTRFEKYNSDNPEKVTPFWNKALEAKALSKELKDYVNNTKYELISIAEGITQEEAKTIALRDIKKKDKYDAPTRYFIGNSNDGSAGKAGEMRKKIEKYKEDIIKLVEPEKRGMIKLGLDTKGPFYDAGRTEQNWEMYNFYHTILAADVAILNNIVGEIQNIEYDVVNHLMNEIGASDFKIDQIGATVVPRSQYVFQGENYEAEVFVTAMDTKQSFSANIGGVSRMSENGVIKISLPSTSPGPKKVTGTVFFKKPDGTDVTAPVEFDYIVAPPSLAVSATKMNVFYVGVDNPVSISAGGVSPDQISATITNGQIVRSGDGWVVRPTTAGTSKITVNAQLDGRVKNMGSVDYRVKYVPNPTAMIANINEGVITKDRLIAARAIIPKMPDDFEFDLYFVITSFNFSGNRRGDIIDLQGKGNTLTPEMIEFIRNARSRERITIDDIHAKGPDGRTRRLSPIVLTLQ